MYEQAKKETVDKVCHIIRKQLALPDDATVIGESNISQLGADSLDTVRPSSTCLLPFLQIITSFHFIHSFPQDGTSAI